MDDPAPADLMPALAGDPVWLVLLALGLGLLVGLDRGWQARERPAGQRVAGIRTFSLIGLLGGLGGAGTAHFGPWLSGALVLALAAVLGLAYWRESVSRGTLSATDSVAALAVLVVGLMAGAGAALPAVVAGVSVAALLNFRTLLHSGLQHLSGTDLTALIRLAVLSLVVLPLLPDRGYGPFEALNPFRIWLMAVLIAGLSFLGYAAIRLGGARRGVAGLALMGGLVSSTAVSINLARLSRQAPGQERLLAGGIVASGSVMFLRLLLVMTAVAPALAGVLVWPLVSAGLVGLGFFALAGMRGAAPDETMRDALIPTNPLALSVALPFAGLLALVLLASRALTHWLGTGGLYGLSVVSGLGDVDAISLSLADMAGKDEVAVTVAATGVLLAAAANSLVKPLIVGMLGGWRLGLMVLVPLMAALLAAGGALALTV
ncbi:MgtC/SapB family protein [Yunchengibacter salinarum]|uniref:MgtC/SapB family protein n=1 Tax=Yunchengibacter salinarum TaxID=3133399 RepID=UPI0035B62236